MDDMALMKKLSQFGPPATIRFDQNKQEKASVRVIGHMASEPFLKRIKAALGPQRDRVAPGFLRWPKGNPIWHIGAFLNCRSRIPFPRGHRRP